MKLSNFQIFLLRLVMGGLFLSLGIEKYQGGWFSNPEQLISSLNNFHQHAKGAQLTYLDAVALPYVNIWTRLIAAGELGLGISLLLGLFVRLSTVMGIFLVLALHAATGNLFSLNFFGSPSAGVLVAALFILFLARAGRWAGIDTLLTMSNPKGMLW